MKWFTTKQQTLMKKMKIKNLLMNINDMRFFTFLFACLCSLFTWAQSGQLFNIDNQLSCNLATQVFQDSNGFIWITTRNGLNVYDGYNFTITKKASSLDCDGRWHSPQDGQQRKVVVTGRPRAWTPKKSRKTETELSILPLRGKAFIWRKPTLLFLRK